MSSAVNAVVEVPGAPVIPGLQYRRYSGPGDLPEMVRVSVAARFADQVERATSVEAMTVMYEHASRFDPARDVILAEVDDRLVAYAQVEWEDVTAGGRTYDSSCVIHPDWRRRGLGRPMLRYNEARLREIAAAQGYEGPRWLGTWTADGNAGARALYEQEGYQKVRTFFHMLRPTLDDIPEPALPAGLEMRPAEPAHDAAVWAADVEAFRDHFGGVDDSEESFRSFIEDPRADRSLWIIAWDGPEIAGLVINMIDPMENDLYGYRRGWLDSVAVRRPWRRRGLARALILESLRLLRERGMTSASLGVDAENPNEALHLYTSTGFRVHRSSAVYRKPWDPIVGPEWRPGD